MQLSRTSLLLCFTLMGLINAGWSQATLIISIEQVGSNVVATGSGSINIAPSFTNSTSGTGLVPSAGFIFLSQPVNGGEQYVVSGPASFGLGGVTFASSSSGDTIDLLAAGSLILSPSYVAGSSLSATDTFTNTTLATLGITTGTYNYTVGSGPSTDSLTLYAGVPVPSASVPEPATFGMAAVGCPALAMWVIRRRKQNIPVA